MDAKTVGAVAALTGVSVRTLHHYDHIGLVVPSVRTPAGYRGYTDADIERLHLVLVYRAVGLPLDEIRTLLDDGDADVVAHLRRQHALLSEQADRLNDTIKAVEELMNAHRKGIQLSGGGTGRDLRHHRIRRASMPTRPSRGGATPTPGHSRSSGRQASPRTTGSGSRPTAMRCWPRWPRPSARGSHRGRNAQVSWRGGTAHRSSSSTNAATKCSAAWWRCT